jgi:hypothetical protein
MLVSSRCKSYPSCMVFGKESSQLRQLMRRFAATLALLALLLPGVSSLAESLSASDLPACCNTSYCPLHHRDASSLQRDRKNCDSTGAPEQNNCSMRACDAVSKPVVGSALFVLITPAALRGPSTAEVTFFFPFHVFPSAPSFPLTPPPRPFLS